MFIIVFWFGSDRLAAILFFVPLYFFPYGSLLTFIVCFLILFHSYYSRARVFGKTLVREFPISYSHTEWYLLFSNIATTRAQETLETR